MSRNIVSLSSRLTRIGASLLFIALLSIASTLWITWQIDGGAAAVNEAGRMRMLAWRMTSILQKSSSYEQIQDVIKQIDESLLLLKKGDPSRPLYVPWDEKVLSEYNIVLKNWESLKADIYQNNKFSNHIILDNLLLQVGAIDRFVSSIEKQLTQLTAILNLFQFLMMTLALAGAVVMLYTGYMYIINPLQNISAGLAKLSMGDFSVRVNLGTRDEFGQLADGFNRMAATLHSLYGKLEVQVENKTRHIEAQRVRLEALYDVSAFIATVNSIDELSKGFIEKVRISSKADAAAIRWSAESSQRYMLLASSSFPSEIESEERSIIAGACSCGSSDANSKTRVIPISRSNELPMKKCAKAGYHSLINVPIRLQHRVVGEINLFFKEQTTLSTEEVDLLDTLASHLASAMESMRATALEKEAAVVEERVLIANELHDSIAQSLVFLRIQTQLIRETLKERKIEQLDVEVEDLDLGISECLINVRELLLHFRISNKEENLETALRETLHKFERQTGLSTKLISTGDSISLLPDVQIQVLHILQEALSNVRKHAQATEVTMKILKGDCWVFEVSDDGVGCDLNKVSKDGHVGIKIMSERAQRINSKFELIPNTFRGVTARLTVPNVVR